MRRRRTRRLRTYGRGRFRVGVTVFALALTALLLVSCMAGSNVLWVRGWFGWDVGDYSAEPTERTLETDGAVALELCDTVEVVLERSVHLKTFRGASQALKYYRDAILNHMLRNQYSTYTGNAASLKAVAQEYPTLSSATLIPAADLEKSAALYFGSSSVSHKSGDRFDYLKRAEYYTTAASARPCEVTVEVLSVEETANTYRMEFKLHSATDTSDTYRAIFVKRDGGAYWKALEMK